MTTSIRIGHRLKIFTPVDVDPPRVQIDALDNRRHVRNQPFRSRCAYYPQQRMRAVLKDLGNVPERSALSVDHFETFESTQ